MWGGSAEGTRVAAYYIIFILLQEREAASTTPGCMEVGLFLSFFLVISALRQRQFGTRGGGGFFVVAKSWVDDKWSFRNKVFGSYKMRLRELQHSGFFFIITNMHLEKKKVIKKGERIFLFFFNSVVPSWSVSRGAWGGGRLIFWY